jgi:hypothetical protein
VYGFFNKKQIVQLFLLYENAEVHTVDSALVYDTNAHGVHPERISPCARIDNFTKAKVLKFHSAQRNVLLKYKGDGLTDIRTGNGIGRVGLIGRLQGRRFSEGKLDFSTNVLSQELAYSVQLLDS